MSEVPKTEVEQSHDYEEFAAMARELHEDDSRGAYDRLQLLLETGHALNAPKK